MKRETVCHIIAASFSFIVAAPIVAMLSDREPCYTIIGGDPTPNPAKSGQAVDMRYVINVSTTGCGGKFYRVIEDSSGLKWTTQRLPITFGNFPIGSHQTSSAQPLILPKFSGEVTVHSVMEQRRLSNPIHLLWPIVYQGPKFKIKITQNGTALRDGD